MDVAELARRGSTLGKFIKLCGRTMFREGQWHARGHPTHPDQVSSPSQHPGPSQAVEEAEGPQMETGELPPWRRFQGDRRMAMHISETSPELEGALVTSWAQ